MALPKPFPNNPRKITAERLAALGESLIEFGDLSAIVINVGKGKYKNCIVSANQRSKHIPLDDITWTVKHDTPTPAGTVREGYVLHGGERFAVREVSWDDKKCEVANLRANNYGGQNDASLLKFFDDDVLILGGIEGLVLSPEGRQKPEIKDEEVRFFQKTHILFSFPPSVFPEIQNLVEQIKNIGQVEYEQSSN